MIKKKWRFWIFIRNSQSVQNKGCFENMEEFGLHKNRSLEKLTSPRILLLWSRVFKIKMLTTWNIESVLSHSGKKTALFLNVKLQTSCSWYSKYYLNYSRELRVYGNVGFITKERFKRGFIEVFLKTLIIRNRFYVVEETVVQNVTNWKWQKNLCVRGAAYIFSSLKL